MADGDKQDYQALSPRLLHDAIPAQKSDGVTLANGRDNVGVYIPLFATAPGGIPIYVAAFAVMTAVWCGLGYFVVNNPLLGAQMRRYGHVLLPLVLIALGLYILSGAVALVR